MDRDERDPDRCTSFEDREPPAFAGGQGRSALDTEATGIALIWILCACVIALGTLAYCGGGAQ